MSFFKRVMTFKIFSVAAGVVLALAFASCENFNGANYLGFRVVRNAP